MLSPTGQEIATAALPDDIFRDTSIVFYIAKADGSHAITYVSPNVEKMLGYPPAAWPASSSFWRDRVHPEDFERVTREFASFFETNRQVVEYRLLSNQGDYLWVKDEFRLMREPGGEPAYLSGFWYDVSAHKNREAALRDAHRDLQEKECFLQSVLDNIPQRLFWKDRQSVFHGCNLAGAREVGLERPEDIEGKTDFNLHHDPMVADYLRNTDEAVMAAGQATYHAAVPLRQGEVWLDVTKVPLRNENGEVTGLLISYEDVSAQKKAEASLRQSEMKFSTLYNSTGDAVMLLDDKGFFDCNPAALAIFGCATKEEFCSKHPAELSPPEQPCGTDSLLLANGWIAAALENGNLRFDWVHRRADIGKCFPAEVLLSPMVLDGKPVLQAVVRDITKRKQAMEELKFMNAALHTQLETSIDGILLVDENGKILSSNQRFADLWGIPTEIIESGSDERALQSVVDKLANPAEFLNKVKYLYASKNEKSRDEIALKDGRTFDRYSAPMFGEDGKYYGRVWYFRDITEQKQAETALRTLNETLEQRVKEETARNMTQERLLIQQSRHAAMGEMIGNIAHQWRQPLNTVGLIVQNIAADYQDGLLDMNALVEYKKTALDTVRKMSQTIDDFRNFFRPNHPNEVFNLSIPITEALNLIGASLKNNAIAVTVDCTENLTVFGSPNEFSQVMLNLLANAKDALIEKKSPLKTITVSARKEDDQTLVSVKDNGGGIHPENMEKIFDPYFTSKAAGTGIGLYMSRVIVEQHLHGKITCRNTEDGAEFLLSLPGEDGRSRA